MKNLKNITLSVITTLSLASCSKSDDTQESTAIFRPSVGEWYAIRNTALQNQTQHFTMTAGAGVITFTSLKGVTLSINGNCLTKNGIPVTGAVDIEYVELFDKGHMLTTNKATMGVMANGDKNLLKSGGEFFIKATQGGVSLATTCNINLIVPTNLTAPADVTMTLWTGDVTNADNLAWRAPGAAGQGGVDVGGQGTGGGTNYYVSFGNFGWTNVDRFYSDPRPKTTILVGVPDGYNDTNCSVYLSYDGDML